MSDGKDYYYFEEDRSPQRVFYDWESLIIHLDCNELDINIQAITEKIDESKKKVFSKLVHEYIHFLQNFSTNWGIPIFSDYALAHYKIGASSMQSKDKVSLPLLINPQYPQLLNDGLAMRNSVTERLNKHFETHQDLSISITLIQRVSVEEECVTLFNGILTSKIGLRAIREHMAYLGEMLFLDKNEDEIHQVNAENFKDSGFKFSRNPEYWIVYEYFIEKYEFKSLSKGLFFLMQHCLRVLNPEKSFYRFLNWIESKNITSGDLISVIKEWIEDRSSKEMDFVKVAEGISRKHIESLIELTNKYKDEHDYARFVNSILAFSLDNLNKSDAGKSLFSVDDNFSSITYWKGKIAKYGSSIVRYKDAIKLHGAESYTKAMHDPFMFMLSASIITRKLTLNSISRCSFVEDIPICGAKFKEQDNCYKNPFLVTDIEEGGGCCLFRSGVLMLGMEDRL